jgi:hypothetical protein
MAWNRKVAVKDGQVLDYVGYYEERAPEVVWEDVKVFGATLKLTDRRRGRSAMTFFFDDLTTPGRSYPMKVGSFFDALLLFGMSPGGEITGVWSFGKQGQNYSLIPVEVEAAADAA